MLEDAKEYLLFTTGGSHTTTSSNPFYAYYYLNWKPSATPQGKFENLVKQICDLKEKKLDSSHQISALYELIEETPTLIHHTSDPRHFSFSLTYKNIFYFSVQWNEPGLLDWLLSRFPDQKNVLTKNEFGMSPLDFAVTKGHIAIFDILKKYYGADWVKAQLEAYINSDDIEDKFILLTCYEALFPDAISTMMSNPLLLPALIKTGKIADPDSTKLKRAMIGCPKLYTALDSDMRKDPYMIVAFLAQQPEEAWLHSLPLRDLDPKLAIALADHWPVLKNRVQDALRRDAPPYPNYCSYAGFQKACLGVIFGIAVAYVTWHFFPIIMLWPEALAGMALILPATIVPLSLMLGPMFIGSYLGNIYPEARKINSILQQNGFFKPSPAGGATHTSHADQERAMIPV